MDEELKIDLLTLAHGINETNKKLTKIKDTSSAMLADSLIKISKMIKDYVVIKSIDDEWQEIINDKQK